MDERTFELWRRILLIAVGSMAVFGVGLVLFDTRVLVGTSFTERLSRAVWGQAALPAQVATYHRFVHAVLGATIAGWAVTMLFVVHHPFRRREAWAWWALLAGPAVWFALDVGSSIYFRVWPNAVLNLVSYVPLLVPLLFTRRAFRAADERAS